MWRSSGDGLPVAEMARRLGMLLAVVAGSIDAITFSRLGEVFAGVMTGNMVLMALAVADREPAVIGHVLVVLGAFVGGALLAGRASRGVNAETIWPRNVTRILLIEFLVLILLLIGWQFSGGTPQDPQQSLLLAGAGLAMGLQAGAVMAIGIPGLATTYMTGTLTGVMTTVGRAFRVRKDSLLLLGALLSGALLSALATTYTVRLALLIPLLALMIVIGIAWRSPRLGTDGRA